MALAVAILRTITVDTDFEYGDNLDDSDHPNLHDSLDHKPQRRTLLHGLGRLWILVIALTQQCLHLPHQLLPEPRPGPHSLTDVPFATLSKVPARRIYSRKFQSPLG